MESKQDENENVINTMKTMSLNPESKDGQIDEENTGKLTEMEEREEAKDFEGQLDKL